jgi:uncharacterized protein YdaU (DUF1376 family)
MTRASLPYLAFFVRDFLASTQGYTLAETGAYFLLLGAQWEQGPLPDDIARLALIARTSPKEFKRIWRKVREKFAVTPQGLVNWRLEEHRQEAFERRERRQEGAKLTNQKRWGGRSADVIPIAERVAERSLGVSPPSPSPSPSLQRLTKGGSDYLRSTEGQGVFPNDGQK